MAFRIRKYISSPTRSAEYRWARRLSYSPHKRTLSDVESYTTMSKRSESLAERVEQGAKALLSFAEGLSDAEWTTQCPGDGRTVGVLVHHVAYKYSGEINVIHFLASGGVLADVT